MRDMEDLPIKFLDNKFILWKTKISPSKAQKFKKEISMYKSILKSSETQKQNNKKGRKTLEKEG